jgi:hypothetical protein
MDKEKIINYIKIYYTFLIKCMILPTLYLGYFFNFNWGTLVFYGFLVSLSVANSYNIYVLCFFLCLLDIPIIYGILAVLMKFNKTRPFVYSILGKENVIFFLGNPGQTAVQLATRASLVLVGGVATTIATGLAQDLANVSAAKSYIEVCKSANIPIQSHQVESLFNRTNPLDLRTFSWIVRK